MSGLVGYGSSDEEEDVSTDVHGRLRNAPTTSAQNVIKNQEIHLNGSHVGSQIVTAPVQGPTAGPSTSDHGDFELEGYEEDRTPTVTPMPEQDMLRHLTQPSHPVASFPLEPEGEADAQVTAKFKTFLELRKKGIRFNENLADKTSFKNPNLFASLLERISIPPETQYISSLPSDILSLDLFPPWTYKEELSRSQQSFDARNDASKKAQSAAGKRTIQFTTANNDSSNGDGARSDVHIKRKRY